MGRWAGGALFERRTLAMDSRSRHVVEAALVVVGIAAAAVLIYGVGGDILSALGV
jgi:hypothetical protein